MASAVDRRPGLNGTLSSLFQSPLFTDEEQGTREVA